LGYKLGYTAEKAHAPDVRTGQVFGRAQWDLVLLATRPKTLVEIDTRAPIVRHSLKTDDLAKARAQRDILEKADNELWAAMLLDGKELPETLQAYKAAKQLSESLGFSYRPADDLARRPIEALILSNVPSSATGESPRRR
jgi:hypothetical protein